MEEKKLSIENFLTAFIAILKAKGIKYFDRDILEKTIYNYKNNEKFKEVLGNVKFKSNGIHYYSNELSETLSMLHLFNYFSTNGLDLSDPKAKIGDVDIKSCLIYSIDYFEEIMQFVDLYLYDVERDNLEKTRRIYEKYAQMEEVSSLNAAEIIKNMSGNEETNEKYQKLFRTLD